MKNNKITILTTAKNSSEIIIGLIESLNSQTSNCFHWLVVDGSDNSDVANIIKVKANFPYEIIASKDYSIYHALNIGIELIKTNYYVVAGSDDRFDADFISNVNFILSNNDYDLILGSVRIGEDRVHTPSIKYGSYAGTDAAHAVGTIIKTSLHTKHGLYSNKYPIVADKFFLKKVLIKEKNFFKTEKIFGYYAQEGFSSVNKIDYICDLFKMQVQTGENLYLQLILLGLRIIRHKLI